MMDIGQQQVNRLSTLDDEKTVSSDYVKALVEAQTGKPVKTIRAFQVFGKSADYAAKNKAFYAINLTIFPE